MWRALWKEFKIRPTAEFTREQLNDLARVQKHIPAGMLGSIESYASELASKITAGADLASLDLKSIGESVLSGCSKADVDALANNIGDLLPALGSLQAMVQQQTGVTPDIPLSMLSTLAPK